EVNGVTIKRAAFTGKLVAPLSEKTLVNANGKNFKVATIEFANVDGEMVRTSAICHEGNYSKGTMKVGEKYQCQVSIIPGYDSPFVSLSHLVAGGERATFDMFGISVDAPVVAEGAE